MADLTSFEGNHGEEEISAEEVIAAVVESEDVRAGFPVCPSLSTDPMHYSAFTNLKMVRPVGAEIR